MQLIKKFLANSVYKDYEIQTASTDASFRRYFRISKDEKSFIVMDSSLEKESLKPFVEVTKKLLKADVDAPKIYFENLEEGFLVLEDFGSQDLLSSLNKDNFKKYYKLAINEILKMQKADTNDLPMYDEVFLKKEMSLMKEWFIEKFIKDKNYDTAMIDEALNYIAKEVLSQPQGYFVHRDFHSRNIMLRSDESLGVIDYQDAMNGSITYDLVSLLRDLYIRFEPNDIEELALYFRDIAGIDANDKEFMRWFDFMGMQRHIKVLGIFSRLYLRDGKDGYLKDLPLTLQYLLESASKYDETSKLYGYLKTIRL
ncbi:phosphotransferase [Sulfurimonas lithotrophica]|uniref:Phosphotransferase n=1 Tax=Sulfurimonas lithotrophica TaxID=2590022 RepID=A0A5P8P0L6_9BACT|nr:phosphotransferase [Sulfurimonas lithotrophica]QFR49150.1 phosphotransferase [Sulfurimonas lithotrophica]